MHFVLIRFHREWICLTCGRHWLNFESIVVSGIGSLFLSSFPISPSLPHSLFTLSIFRFLSAYFIGTFVVWLPSISPTLYSTALKPAPNFANQVQVTSKLCVFLCISKEFIRCLFYSGWFRINVWVCACVCGCASCVSVITLPAWITCTLHNI